MHLFSPKLQTWFKGHFVHIPFIRFYNRLVHVQRKLVEFHALPAGHFIVMSTGGQTVHIFSAGHVGHIFYTGHIF